MDVGTGSRDDLLNGNRNRAEENTMKTFYAIRCGHNATHMTVYFSSKEKHLEWLYRDSDYWIPYDLNKKDEDEEAIWRRCGSLCYAGWQAMDLPELEPHQIYEVKMQVSP